MINGSRNRAPLGRRSRCLSPLLSRLQSASESKRHKMRATSNVTWLSGDSDAVSDLVVLVDLSINLLRFRWQRAIGTAHDVTRDGRLLINTKLDNVAVLITLVQNWQPADKASSAHAED